MFPTTEILDPFPGPSLGNWSILNTDGSVFAISSGQIRALNAAYSSMVYTVESYGPDCEAGITYNGAGTAYAAVCARVQGWGGANTWDGYSVSWDAGSVYINVITNGAATALATYSQTINAGDKVGIECIGNQISAYVDTGSGWTLLGTVTNNTYPGTGRIGVELYDPQGDEPMDDFFGGTVIPFPTNTTLLDNFNRASLDGNWSQGIYTGEQLQITSNRLDNVVGWGSATWNVATYGPDVEHICTIGVLGTFEMAFKIHNMGSAPNGYFIHYESGQIQLWKMVAGTQSSVGAAVSVAFAATDKIGIETRGSVINVYRWTVASKVWTLVMTRTDSTYATTVGRFGYLLNGGEMDNMSGGTRTAPITGLPVAQDDFERTVSAGSVWGTSDVGGSWTRYGSSVNYYSVGSGVGVMNVAAAFSGGQVLTSISEADVDMLGLWTWDEIVSGGNMFPGGFIARYAGANDFYACQLRIEVGTPANLILDLRRHTTAAGSNSIGALPVIATDLDASEEWWLRFQVVGSTVRARAWRKGTPEPAEWQDSVTNTEITAAGGVGTRYSTGGGSSNTPFVTLDYFKVLDLAGGSGPVVTPITIPAGLTMTAALTRTPIRPKTIAASVTMTPAVSRLGKYYKTVAANVALTPAVLFTAKHFRTIAAGVTLASAISRRLGKTIAAGLNTNPVLAFAKSKFLTLANTMTSAISLTRKGTYYKTLAAGATMTPAMTRRNTAYKTLAVNTTMAAQVQMIRMGRISLQSNLPLTNIVVKRGNATLNSVVNLAGAISLVKTQGGATQITLAAGLQLQAAAIKTTLVRKTISAALFLDAVLRRDQFVPDDGAEDWLIDAKSLDTPQLDAAQLHEAVLERTTL